MRKRKPQLRNTQPDPVYGDQRVTRFVNNLMYSGKKSTSYQIFYDAMKMIEDKSGENGYETWKKALANVTPGVEVRSKRIGGATFQIPTEIRASRKESVSIKWIIGFARKRNGKSMAEKLSAELMAAAKNEGAAIKRKEDTHRMAEANKAFSHFRV